MNWIKLISINVQPNADKSLVGELKFGRKEDARLAVSLLHHKKIGYKRLSVNVAYSPSASSPR